METEGIVETTGQGAETSTSGDSPATTTTESSHTPNVTELLKQLESVKDQIQPDQVRFLDKHFQPAFSRRYNLLNDSVNEGVKTALGDAGLQLPEGKSGLDLLTENGGKDFWNTVRNVVSNEFKPLKEKISAAEQQGVLQGAIMRARKDDPNVEKHWETAIQEIDQSPDLTKLAMAGGGNGLYYVLQGVSAVHEARAKDARIRELSGLLEANKISVKTANGTTKSGSGTPKQQQAPTKAKTIKEALGMARDLYKEREV